MKLPTICGVIRRRLLINYRIDPNVVAAILPTKLRPKIVNNYAIAGICLIRLENIRPSGFPFFTGISSENSAHRIAVEWDSEIGSANQGVFVPRRDTDSKINSLAGGRIFPGVHHYSKFYINDKNGEISVQVRALDTDSRLLEIEATETKEFSSTSVFESLSDSSSFFEAGNIGYSVRPNTCDLDGLLLKIANWEVSPLDVTKIRSSYFDDLSLFPEGSIEFDHALLMRDCQHEWHALPTMMSE